MDNSFEEEAAHLASVLTHVNEQLTRFGGAAPLEEREDREAQTADEVAELTVESLRERERMSLRIASREPYFGRLDFTTDGEQGISVLYIGKRGVEDKSSGDRLVVDWRAPAASMFYSFSGKGDAAQYEAPDGVIQGRISLKRNIVIRDSRLQRVVDSFVSGQQDSGVSDEFLLYRLAENKDIRLRDIVSTIQSEQDAIIRAPRNRVIVIQGVAGSGKTTVALHRLAYLLYQYGERLRAERMVIFAPSAMFVDYISEVLPELGVGGVQQTTFAAFAQKVLDYQVYLEDESVRLRQWFEDTADENMQALQARSQRKGRLAFARCLDDAVAEIERTLIPNTIFEPWDGLRLQIGTIRHWLYTEYANYPIGQRRQRILARIKRWYEIAYKDVKAEDNAGAIRKSANGRYRAYAKLWQNISAIDVYQRALERSVDVENTTSYHRLRPTVRQEDLAALVYLQTKLFGVDSNFMFDHVVIDEAQDFSPLQLHALKPYCRGQSFSILGDVSQSIHTYQGIEDWRLFLDQFSEAEQLYYQLDVSYRSTSEIIEFANDILRPFAKTGLAKPVFRSGDEVIVERVEAGQRIGKIVEAIADLREQAETIAVICRTAAAAQEIGEWLQDLDFPAHLIATQNESYAGGLSVLPIYLAKGLEFDAVLLVDVSHGSYTQTARDARLLYVGCTRALHNLRIQYTGEPSLLLAGVRRFGDMNQVIEG